MFAGQSAQLRYVRQPLIVYKELEGQRPGLSAVVEKVFEVEDADALFSVFALKKQRQSLIIGRSRKDTIELNRLLEAYGGGGHPQAASALLKGQIGEQVMSTLQMYLDRTMAPAVTAGEIMSDHVEVIDAGWGLMEASIFLERIKHTGAPVTDRDGKIVGFVTLRDIMKGRSAGGIRSPVTAYMTRKVITAGRQTTIREIQNLMFENDIGHLPVVEKDRLIGIVTRSDLIRFLETRQEENRRVLVKVGEELHEEAQAAEP